MRFTLSFDMDGAAFDGGDNAADEVMRILHATAAKVDHRMMLGFDLGGGYVRDMNGNTIGEWEVIDDSAPDRELGHDCDNHSPGDH